MSIYEEGQRGSLSNGGGGGGVDTQPKLPQNHIFEHGMVNKTACKDSRMLSQLKESVSTP